MKKILFCFLFLSSTAFAAGEDIGVVTGSLYVPYRFDYPLNTNETNVSRSFLFFPGLGIDLNVFASALGTGIYLGYGFSKLRDEDATFDNQRSSVFWNTSYFSLRYYTGNKWLSNVPASGFWIGFNFGKGKVKVDYDNEEVTDPEYNGDLFAKNLGYDFAIGKYRVGPYLLFERIDVQGGDVSSKYYASTIGVQGGYNF